MAERITPEVATQLIAHDLDIGYDEVLEVLQDEAARNHGGMIDNSAPYRKHTCTVHADAGPRLIRIGSFVLLKLFGW